MIYVKIIGQFPDIPENEGVLIKISKACAEKLAAIDKSIKVNLLYGINKE